MVKLEVSCTTRRFCAWSGWIELGLSNVSLRDIADLKGRRSAAARRRIPPASEIFRFPAGSQCAAKKSEGFLCCLMLGKLTASS